MKKIYQCFPFFNEYDLLELRLTECYDHTDYFVIAESNKTFTGNPKPYNLEENWDRFKQFQDKIIYVKVDDMPNTDNPWLREYHQRNALIRGLTNATDDDIIILSDCDEIPRPRTMQILRNDCEHMMWNLRHPMFYFKLNYLFIEPQCFRYSSNTVAVVKKFFDQNFGNFQNLRNPNRTAMPYDYNTETVRTIQHAAWHFTYLGDRNNLDLKFSSYSHTESQPLVGKLDIDEMISKNINWDQGSVFTYVKIDNYYPKTVINNLEKWSNHIIPNATASIREYLTSLDMDEIYNNTN
jgi:hypothetical protein